MRAACCFAALLVIACGKQAESPAPGVAPTAQPPTPAPIDAAGTRKKLGEDCAGGAACALGLTCIPWTTEGGERHATCEMACGPAPGYLCPSGTGCVHQGGGPSGVCLKR